MVLVQLLPLKFITNEVDAQSGDGFVSSRAPLILQDEGTIQGAISTLNCVGAGVACTRVGAVGTATIAGGGAGSANVVAVTIDFGVGSTTALTVVTGQAWVTGTSVIVCSPTLMITADRITEGQEDALIEVLTVTPYARVVGTGFTVAAHPAHGWAFHKFLIHCTGA